MVYGILHLYNPFNPDGLQGIYFSSRHDSSSSWHWGIKPSWLKLSIWFRAQQPLCPATQVTIHTSAQLSALSLCHFYIGHGGQVKVLLAICKVLWNLTRSYSPSTSTASQKSIIFCYHKNVSQKKDVVLKGGRQKWDVRIFCLRY